MVPGGLAGICSPPQRGAHTAGMMNNGHFFPCRRRCPFQLPLTVLLVVALSGETASVLPVQCDVYARQHMQESAVARQSADRSRPRAGRELSALLSLRGGSDNEIGASRPQSASPLTPMAPAALALQEELGRVTKEWVKERGRTGAEPGRDLQTDIDEVIAKWTQTAIATPRTVLQSDRVGRPVAADHLFSSQPSPSQSPLSGRDPGWQSDAAVIPPSLSSNINDKDAGSADVSVYADGRDVAQGKALAFEEATAGQGGVPAAAHVTDKYSPSKPPPASELAASADTVGGGGVSVLASPSPQISYRGASGSESGSGDEGRRYVSPAVSEAVRSGQSGLRMESEILQSTAALQTLGAELEAVSHACV